jgi:hypothetical protein
MEKFKLLLFANDHAKERLALFCKKQPAGTKLEVH